MRPWSNLVGSFGTPLSFQMATVDDLSRGISCWTRLKDAQPSTTPPTLSFSTNKIIHTQSITERQSARTHARNTKMTTRSSKSYYSPTPANTTSERQEQSNPPQRQPSTEIVSSHQSLSYRYARPSPPHEFRVHPFPSVEHRRCSRYTPPSIIIADLASLQPCN